MSETLKKEGGRAVVSSGQARDRLGIGFFVLDRLSDCGVYNIMKINHTGAVLPIRVCLANVKNESGRFRKRI